MAAVTTAVAGLVDTLADDAVRDLTHNQLTELVIGARRAQARLDAVLFETAGEVGARGSHSLDAALTLGSWLRQHIRLTPGQATGLATTARVLRSGVLPATRAALAAGELSGEHARVIAAGVAGAPAGAVALIEPEVVHTATRADLRATAAVLRAFRHALDPDGADAAALARYERAGITLSPTLDGSMAIHGTADEVTGAVLATAIDTAGPLVSGDTRTAARRRLTAWPTSAGPTWPTRTAPVAAAAATPISSSPSTSRACPTATSSSRDSPSPARSPPASTIPATTGQAATGPVSPPRRPGGVSRDRAVPRAGRCPGSGGSPGPPPAGPAATPSTPSSPSARTARSSKPAPPAGSSRPPSAGPSSPATATAAAARTATGRSPGLTPTT
jgi:hypothetical protein